MKRRHLLATLAAAAATAPLQAAHARVLARSDRPIRLIVPFAAGGSTDLAARALQEPLQRLLGQPVVIEHRTGAGGTLGTAEVARAAPDGLTLGVATASTHGVNPAVYRALPYDPVGDFSAVTELVRVPGLMVINPETLPVKDLADFVRQAKARPGELAYASPGVGTMAHMQVELFQAAAGIRLTHVAYRGTAPAQQDVLGGRVPMYMDQAPSALPQLRAGRLRALAVSWPTRLEALPDVPTYTELGYAVMNEPTWFGLVAPAGTPAAAVQRVQQAAARALQEPAVRQRLHTLGLHPSGSSPAEFARQIGQTVASMKALAKTAGIQLD